MSDNRSGMLTPALIWGAIAGILSAIPFLNCLCCIWIVGGAMGAAWLLARNCPVSLSAGDGALTGALTGVVAAVVNAVVSIPLQAVNADVMRRFVERMSEFTEEMPEGWDRWLGGGMEASPAFFFLGLLVSAAIFAVLGTLGGLLGASFFGRKPASPAVPPAAPPPPELPR